MSFTVIIPSKTDQNAARSVCAVESMEPGARIIVVDDGLTDFWLNRTAPERAMGEKPFIFSRNINIGIRAAGDDDVILLNDDALLETHRGLSRMRRLAHQFNWGLVSATTNISGNRRQLQTNPASAIREEPRTVPFICVFIPRSTINRVGLLDERFTAYGWEDNDYCRRIREAGLRIGIWDGCFVDHSSLRHTFRRDITAGAEIYRAKWGNLR